MLSSRLLRTSAALAAAAGVALALAPATPLAHAAAKPAARVHPYQYRGYLTAAPSSTTAPTTLTIQTTNRGQIAVTVEPSTRIVRRYGGPSGLGELSANDVLQVRGSTTAPGTVTATYIRDLSIQVAYTRLIGQVTSVGSNSVSVVVQRDIYARSPFIPGQNVTLPVGPSTKVISGTATTTGSTAGITTGTRILALGVYNRAGNTFQSTFRIRLLGMGGVTRPASYSGYLMTAPATTTAPVTLMIQTPHAGQIAISVTPSTKIVRRYGGPSGLDELSANDVLQVRGSTTAPGVVTATAIRDISIQVAYTRLVGQVTAVSPTSVAVVVQRDARGRAPFGYGQNLTLPVGSSTQVISGTTTTTGSTSLIAVGARVAALGVFNTISHAFQSTFRIRVLK